MNNDTQFHVERAGQEDWTHGAGKRENSMLK
jgi:hypothetical protein